MKLHVANAVAVSILSTAVLVLALKDKSCPSPTPAAGIQTAPTAQGPGAANPRSPCSSKAPASTAGARQVLRRQVREVLHVELTVAAKDLIKFRAARDN